MTTDPKALLEGTTPGPWGVSVTGDVVVTERGSTVADVTTRAQRERVEANARLIAAAPDLATEVATLRAENDSLRSRLEEAILRYIEASNPGIDIDEVRKHRAASVSSEGSG